MSQQREVTKCLRHGRPNRNDPLDMGFAVHNLLHHGMGARPYPDRGVGRLLR
jgi:hypothetical protein